MVYNATKRDGATKLKEFLRYSDNFKYMPLTEELAAEASQRCPNFRRHLHPLFSILRSSLLFASVNCAVVSLSIRIAHPHP